MAGEPKWLTIARGELGTKEIPGPKDNPRVVQYYMGAARRETVPWCAAFVGFCLTEAKQPGVHSSGSLMARSYMKWGKGVSPRPGAIAVFPRGSSKVFGHVNFVESVEGDKLICIGGNQSDAVTRARYSRSKALGFRWPADKEK